jgi:hypothetical protein
MVRENPLRTGDVVISLMDEAWMVTQVEREWKHIVTTFSAPRKVGIERTLMTRS